jgi:hypothetical protein
MCDEPWKQREKKERSAAAGALAPFARGGVAGADPALELGDHFVVGQVGDFAGA